MSRKKADREIAKSLALTLADTEVGSHHGRMDIRVRNKVIATFPPQERVMVVRCTPEKLDALTAQNPDVFSKVRSDTWVSVDLDEIDRDTLEIMLREAWELTH